MAAAQLADAVAVSENTELDPEHFIGRLTMFTLPDQPVSGAKAMRSWTANGLDAEDLPEARQPVHVFQSACASVKARRSVDKHGQRTEITADEVHNNGRGCIYQITVKVWDQSADVIEYEKALRVTFDKDSSTISFDDLGAQDARLDAIKKDIQADFDANAKTLPGQKIRNAIRKTLLKLGAQNVRRKAGGVYFVPQQWKPDGRRAKPTKPMLDGLEAVLTDLYASEGDFYAIPMANRDAEREMVRKHFALNVKEKSEEMTLRALQRVAHKGERGVRSDFLENLYNERRRLAASVSQFEQLVSVEKSDIEDNLKDLDEALDKLQEFADEKGDA